MAEKEKKQTLEGILNLCEIQKNKLHLGFRTFDNFLGSIFIDFKHRYCKTHETEEDLKETTELLEKNNIKYIIPEKGEDNQNNPFNAVWVIEDIARKDIMKSIGFETDKEEFVKRHLGYIESKKAEIKKELLEFFDAQKILEKLYAGIEKSVSEKLSEKGLDLSTSATKTKKTRIKNQLINFFREKISENTEKDENKKSKILDNAPEEAVKLAEQMAEKEFRTSEKIKEKFGKNSFIELNHFNDKGYADIYIEEKNESFKIKDFIELSDLKKLKRCFLDIEIPSWRTSDPEISWIGLTFKRDSDNYEKKYIITKRKEVKKENFSGAEIIKVETNQEFNNTIEKIIEKEQPWSIIAYNLPFDLEKLRNNALGFVPGYRKTMPKKEVALKFFQRIFLEGIEVKDLLNFSRTFYKYLPGQKLETVAKHIYGEKKFKKGINYNQLEILEWIIKNLDEKKSPEHNREKFKEYINYSRELHKNSEEFLKFFDKNADKEKAADTIMEYLSFDVSIMDDIVSDKKLLEDALTLSRIFNLPLRRVVHSPSSCADEIWERHFVRKYNAFERTYTDKKIISNEKKLRNLFKKKISDIIYRNLVIEKTQAENPENSKSREFLEVIREAKALETSLRTNFRKELDSILSGLNISETKLCKSGIFPEVFSGRINFGKIFSEILLEKPDELNSLCDYIAKHENELKKNGKYYGYMKYLEGFSKSVMTSYMLIEETNLQIREKTEECFKNSVAKASNSLFDFNKNLDAKEDLAKKLFFMIGDTYRSIKKAIYLDNNKKELSDELFDNIRKSKLNEKKFEKYLRELPNFEESINSIVSFVNENKGVITPKQICETLILHHRHVKRNQNFRYHTGREFSDFNYLLENKIAEIVKEQKFSENLVNINGFDIYLKDLPKNSDYVIKTIKPHLISLDEGNFLWAYMGRLSKKTSEYEAYNMSIMESRLLENIVNISCGKNLEKEVKRMGKSIKSLLEGKTESSDLLYHSKTKDLYMGYHGKSCNRTEFFDDERFSTKLDILFDEETERHYYETEDKIGDEPIKNYVLPLSVFKPNYKHYSEKIIGFNNKTKKLKGKICKFLSVFDNPFFANMLAGTATDNELKEFAENKQV